MPYEFEDQLLHFSEKSHWNFNRNCIESVDCCGDYGHFKNLKRSVHEHKDFFPYI